MILFIIIILLLSIKNSVLFFFHVWVIKIAWKKKTILFYWNQMFAYRNIFRSLHYKHIFFYLSIDLSIYLSIYLVVNYKWI